MAFALRLTAATEKDKGQSELMASSLSDSGDTRRKFAWQHLIQRQGREILNLSHQDMAIVHSQLAAIKGVEDIQATQFSDRCHRSKSQQDGCNHQRQCQQCFGTQTKKSHQRRGKSQQ